MTRCYRFTDFQRAYLRLVEAHLASLRTHPNLLFWRDLGEIRVTCLISVHLSLGLGVQKLSGLLTSEDHRGDGIGRHRKAKRKQEDHSCPPVSYTHLTLPTILLV